MPCHRSDWHLHVVWLQVLRQLGQIHHRRRCSSGVRQAALVLFQRVWLANFGAVLRHCWCGLMRSNVLDSVLTSRQNGCRLWAGF